MPEGTIHIDRALTNVSVGYRNAAYVAEQLYPVVPVDFRSDKYYVYGKDRFRVRDDRRAPGAEALPSRWTLSNDSYFTEGHALKDFVPRENEANQDPALDLQVDTTEVLTDQIELNQEANLVTKLAADLTGTSLADQAGTKWDNDANDPIKLIRAQNDALAKRTGVRANILVISQPVFTAVRQNAKVVGLITGARDLPSALVTADQLAALLELQQVIVAGAVKDTANEGQAASLDWIWGKTAVLAWRPPNPGRKVLALGYTFAWAKALNAMGGQGGGYQFVDRYYWQPNKADVVEVHKYYDLKTIAKDAGCLFTNCIT